MSLSTYDVQAFVLGEKNGVYSLKLEIHNLGIYPHGATLRRSKKNNNWWLQPPKHVVNGKYVADVEFSTKTELWAEMEKAATEAVAEYSRYNNAL